MAHDPAEDQILAELRTLARGFDVFGNRIPHEKQMEAMGAYSALLRKREELDQEERRLKADEDRVVYETMKAAADTEKARAEAIHQGTVAEAEARRIDIEVERLTVEKARVVVEAMAAAASNPEALERLLGVVEVLGDRLLEGPMPVLQLPGPKVDERAEATGTGTEEAVEVELVEEDLEEV